MQFFWNGFSIRFFSLNLRNPAIVGSGQMDLQLQEVERNFPNMSAGVCLAAAEGIFHHGGLHSPNSTKPSSQLAYFDLTKSVWTDISTSDSPKLSNHAGFVTEGRWERRYSPLYPSLLLDFLFIKISSLIWGLGWKREDEWLNHIRHAS